MKMMMMMKCLCLLVKRRRVKQRVVVVDDEDLAYSWLNEIYISLIEFYVVCNCVLNFASENDELDVEEVQGE